MNITWDHSLTARIRAWGKPRYQLWYFFAVQLLNVYLIAWLVFGVMGWLAWQEIPLTAVIAYVIALLVQALLARERPKFEQTTGYKMWWRTYSCPSGHALIASACATTFLLLTHFPTPLVAGLFGAMFIIAALLIGIGRIVVGVHYFADILLGFVLGITVGVVYSVL
jgi:undecaprenyl-diphosphatase